MKIGEILATAFLPVIGAVGREQLGEQLTKLHEANEQGYKAAIQGVYPPLKRLLQPLVKNSKTKIDDTLVDALLGAIEDSAEATGTPLPDVSDIPEVTDTPIV